MLKKIIQLLLILSCFSFSAIALTDLHVASNNIIVATLDADTASADSIPILTGWTINAVDADTTGRYTFIRDESVYYGSSTVYLTYVRHRIYLQMVDSLVNDSTYIIDGPYGTDTFHFKEDSTFNESIKVNQVGYNSKSTVRYANFGVYAGDLRYYYLDTNSLPVYNVIDTTTKEIMYSGALTYWGADTLTPDSGTSEGVGLNSGEFVYRIALEDVPPGGPYFISIVGFGRSYPFGIGNAYSRELARVHTRGLYHQRCGIALEPRYTEFTRGICHDSVAMDTWETWGASAWITVPDGATMSPIRGGYHDAGDFDRRPYHTLIPMLMLGYYEGFENNFKDNQYNIPESGNDIPDFLDEALWGQLIWEYLQVDSTNFPDSTSYFGSVLQGTETNAHPGYGITDAHSNQNSSGVKYKYGTFEPAMDVTAEACGMFAQSSRLISPYDTTRARELLNRATLAHNWLVANDTSLVESEFMYCALEMYLATAIGDSATDYDNEYHVSFRDRATEYIVDGGSYPDQYLLGNNSAHIKTVNFISYLLTDFTTDSTLEAELLASLKSQTDNGGYMVWMPDSSPYAHGVTRFSTWGAITAQGRYADGAAFMYLLSTTDEDKQKYFNILSQYSNYSVGLNPLGQMFVTGLGSQQPQSPLHLDSYWKKYGLEVNSRYTRTPVGNVPGIVLYGAAWERAGTSYQREVTDHLYPIWDYDATIPTSTIDRHMPGLRRWVDGWSAVQNNEFTTWETMVWNVCMYSALYDANEDTTYTFQSSNNLISVVRNMNSVTDTITMVQLNLGFPGIDSVIVTIDDATATTLIADTITLQPSQSRLSVNISTLDEGTYFLKINDQETGVFTKEW